MFFKLYACNKEALTNLSISEEISKDVELVGQPEGVELVGCKPVWVQIGQPEEIELVCID